jgi:hypothetical protein
MEHFAGLDVSVKDTSVCIVDDTGKIVTPPTASSGLDWKLDRCRNGCSALSPKQACQ